VKRLRGASTLIASFADDWQVSGKIHESSVAVVAHFHQGAENVAISDFNLVPEVGGLFQWPPLAGTRAN
jgi:hypothetical protein